MFALGELQRDFAAALCNPSAREIESVIARAGFSPSRRVQIYRHNVFANLGGALAAVYPVVRRLVGEDFWLRCSTLCPCGAVEVWRFA